jgi:demethylmenaquinone methyltransferase/2-methoxy-6-polyprenyl-1,4-benzoquinol methylase
MSDAQHTEKVPGTRPEGTASEREAAARVQSMFGRIAPRYDLLNHLLSFSLDHLWRRRTARRFLPILNRPEARILDLCCGTGDLTLALTKAHTPKSSDQGESAMPVFGGDFAEPMLERALEKAAKCGASAVFFSADALRLPFSDDSFDLVTSAFGFRNLANYEQGLREIWRVLRRGGEVGILEFTEPQSGAMAAAFRFYFHHVLPLLGGAISGSGEAYAYLPSSVAKFPSPSGLVSLMESCEFEGVEFAAWNFGSVVLHSGRKR